jgi:hypothetical protein
MVRRFNFLKAELIFHLQFSQIIFDAQEQPLPACMPEAQWDVRLASALLREKAKGPGSPFFYYIQALPDEILAAVTLDDEDLEKVRSLTKNVVVSDCVTRPAV